MGGPDQKNLTRLHVAPGSISRPVHVCGRLSLMDNFTTPVIRQIPTELFSARQWAQRPLEDVRSSWSFCFWLLGLETSTPVVCWVVWQCWRIDVAPWRSWTTCAASVASRCCPLISTEILISTAVRKSVSEESRRGRKSQWLQPGKPFLFWGPCHCCPSGAPVVYLLFFFQNWLKFVPLLLNRPDARSLTDELRYADWKVFLCVLSCA